MMLDIKEHVIPNQEIHFDTISSSMELEQRKPVDFIQDCNLVNRVYYTLVDYGKYCGDIHTIDERKSNIHYILLTADNLELLAWFFEKQLKKGPATSIERRCNLYELVTDLNYLKQYLDEPVSFKSASIEER